MILRLKKLLHIKNDEAVDGWKEGIGVTTPTDGDAGWIPRADFINTATGTKYVNEGTLASCDFNEVAALTAVQEALLTATAGTASASKALVVDANKDIAGLNNVGVDGALTAGGGITVDSALTNLLTLPAAGTAPVSTLGATGLHGGATKKIAVDINGTTYYLLASTVPTTT